MATHDQQDKGLVERLARQWVSGQIGEDEAIALIVNALSVPPEEAHALLVRAAEEADTLRPIQSEAWKRRGIHPYDTGGFP